MTCDDAPDPTSDPAQVTGIEGTYRMTCESVMTVLRKNKDSLMAVLEAFVYDPLFNWCLVDSPRAVSTGASHLPSHALPLSTQVYRMQ